MSKISNLLRSTALITAFIGLTGGMAHAGSGSIVYQMDYVSQFGSSGNGNGQFHTVEQMTFGPNGNLYVTDRYNSRIQVLDKDGNYLAQFGNGTLSTPAGIVYDSAAHRIYVGDTGNSTVSVFNSDNATFITNIGVPGNGANEVSIPHYLAVDASGNIYAADYGNNRVQVYDAAGNYLRTIGAGMLTNPTGVSISGDGIVYVSDSSNSVIKAFQTNGTYIGNFANVTSRSNTVDQYGNVYVADAGNNRISVYDKNGVLLTSLGTTGTGNGQFSSPSGVLVDRETGVIYASDYSLDRIQKLQLTSTETFNGSPAGGNETAAVPLSNLVLTGTGTFADNFVGYHNLDVNGTNWTLGGTTTLSGAIHLNTGTLTNNGTISNAGSTFVASGTTLNNTGSLLNNYIQVDSGGTINNAGGIINGNIVNNGTGSNTGTLLNALINQAGGVFDNEGTIAFVGNNGGIYSGSGTIGQDLVSTGGTVSLAVNDIVHITGNYSDDNASTYIVSVNAAGQTSKIAAGGTATLGGSTIQINAANGTYHVNNSYVILTAAGGVTGTFGSVSSNLAFLTPTLNYSNPNQVTLTLTRNDGVDPFQTAVDFAPYAASGNQQAAAVALSAYSASAFNGDTATFDAVESLSVADAGKLLNEVSPDQVAAMPAMQNAMITSMQTPMFQRLQSAPVSSSDKSGFGFVTPNDSGSSLSPDQVWLQTIGGVSNQDNSSNGAAGYRLGTVGVRGGADKDISDKTKLGLSFAYAHGNANYKGSNDSSQTQYAHADLYGRRKLDTKRNLILEGFLGAGGGRLDSTRYITAGTFNSAIIGNTNAYDVSGAVKLSNPIRVTQSDIITPNITTAASWTRQNGYTESGSPFALQMNSITSTPITVTPMVNWQHTIKDEKHGFNLTPDFGIGATWQLSELNNNVNANFANSTTAPGFTTQSAKQDPLSLNLSAAVTMQPFTSNKYIPSLTAQATMQSSSTTTNTTGTLTAKWDW